MINTNMSRREIMDLGRVSKMLDAGKTVTEITEALKLPESTVREYKHIIEVARANNFKVK